MSQKKTVLLVMGSTRAGRNCPKITAWVESIGRASTAYEYEIVDLAKWSLPMDDEPAIPAIGPYMQPHTRAWSEKVKGASAVVFITPQFNWGYPAVLKNAIDHLYSEWHDKPLMIVTYGGHGGGRCAKQLRQVVGRLGVRIVPTSPELRLSDWAAAGFKDTLLRWKMKPEVVHGEKKDIQPRVQARGGQPGR